MLRDAIVAVNDHIQNHGDGLIEDGTFHFKEYGAGWLSFNADNHQQTWGVVGAAIEALAQYMITHAIYGWATFRIFDGQNQVGHGSLYAA